MVKINLGCGNDYKEGWANIDNMSMVNCKVDINSNILEYDREPNSVDEILMSHVAMYIRPEEMFLLLKKCKNWLKVGGTLEIETIDIDKVMEEALNPFNGRQIEWGLTNIFGTKDTGPHRWGWNAESLSSILMSVGFEVVGKSNGLKKPNRDFKLTVTK